jgi:hypothetical protein
MVIYKLIVICFVGYFKNKKVLITMFKISPCPTPLILMSKRSTGIQIIIKEYRF